jgi:hypothetical protein
MQSSTARHTLPKVAKPNRAAALQVLLAWPFLAKWT